MDPERRGALCGLLAAALFGASAPAAKWLLAGTNPAMLAGLLYLGAAAALFLVRRVRPERAEARLRPADAGALAAVSLLGGVAGPLLMLLGLARLSAVSASLLLNLEAPLTAMVAVLFFGEHLGRFAGAALALVVVGAGLLQLQPNDLRGDLLGSLSIAAACLCWAFDNNLTQRLSLRDPFAIVRVKALAAGCFNVILGSLVGGGMPSLRTVALALPVGAVSYGISVVLDAYALRLVGAAREAVYFATAPFLGALVSVFCFGDLLSRVDVMAMGLMAWGVLLLLRERHAHAHLHEEVEHEHAHVHDEHHQHGHPPGLVVVEPHSHLHRHTPLVHDHPHVPDLHHRHRHVG